MNEKKLPLDVQSDLDNGFIITDPDDFNQRCKKLSPTAFHYKSGTRADNDLESEIIDVNELSTQDKDDAVSAYYGTMEDLSKEMDGDSDSINMIVAECYFETEFMPNH